MPAYRLIADHGTPVETSEPADDAAGERQGRALAATTTSTWLPRGVVGGPGPQATVRRPR